MIDSNQIKTAAALAWLKANKVGEFLFNSVTRQFTASFNGASSPDVALDADGRVDLYVFARKFFDLDMARAKKVSDAFQHGDSMSLGLKHS